MRSDLTKKERFNRKGRQVLSIGALLAFCTSVLYVTGEILEQYNASGTACSQYFGVKPDSTTLAQLRRKTRLN